MEYNASATKHLFWFMETRETAKLILSEDMERVRQRVIDENLYNQKSHSRLINEFACIKGRLLALPKEIIRMLTECDIKTGKLIVFIACMAADRLLFDMMYELYRQKVYLGEGNITEGDLNLFFKNKGEQNEKVAGISEASIKKLKQVYCKYMFEAGLLGGNVKEKKIVRPYMEEELKALLKHHNMDKYKGVIKVVQRDERCLSGAG